MAAVTIFVYVRRILPEHLYGSPYETIEIEMLELMLWYLASNQFQILDEVIFLKRWTVEVFINFTATDYYDGHITFVTGVVPVTGTD